MAKEFLALDFETANTMGDSACSIGLVRVKGQEIIRKEVHLIRPPYKNFAFTYIHGLTWKHVSSSPTFGDLWPKIQDFFEGIEFIAAHNSGFDRRVLLKCCERYGIKPPEKEFVCTVQLARDTWNIYPTKLPDVCKHLNFELQHHEALSDAEACAKIVMAAQRGAAGVGIEIGAG